MTNEPRYSRQHDPELAEYLEKHTRPTPEGCWEWQRSTDNFGYGLSRWRGVLRRSHRLAHMATTGYFTPPGIVVRHKCDNPGCCNPDHLVEGTRADNNRDRDRRGRHVRLLGEKHGNATLTAEQVLEIRATKGTAKLARKFGVTDSAIYSARTGLTWRHLENVS